MPPSTVPDVIVRRFQDTQRAAVRLEAAQTAAAMLRVERQWSPGDLKTLLDHLQTDWYKGKSYRNRFSPGLTGQHQKWLLESLETVSAWLGKVRAAAAVPLTDEAASSLLTEFWAGPLGGMRVFPTAVLAALEPERFVAFTKPTVKALDELAPGGPYSGKKEAPAYLAVCRAVRTMCEAHGWPLCLSDAALQPEPEADSTETFAGYPPATLTFLDALAAHTKDPAWHATQKETYRRVLRDPTQDLVDTIGARYLTALDPTVAASKRPISVLKKNDYGGEAYHAHYWFAFFDPAAKTKKASAQLFGWYSADVVRYGLGMGTESEAYQDRLVAAMRAAPAQAAALLESLPSDVGVRFEYADGSDARRAMADLAKAVRDGTLDAFLAGPTTIIGLALERELPPSALVQRGAALADDMGQLFVALWPLFQASRTGAFVGGKVEISAPAPPEPDDEDDDIAETIADLAQVTSLPEDTLREIEEALLAKGQVVLSGPPGTSKTYAAERFARYFVQRTPSGRPQGDYRVLYMHSSWAYEDFFEGIRPRVGGTGLEFAHHRGAFLSWVEDVVQKGPPGARFVMVLDEINRCDTAAVLGELLQLMEYRGQTVRLLSGHAFVVPRSLFIIGTMNSADRSIGRIDLALRRRFFFIDLLPDPDVLDAWLAADPARNPNGLDAEALRACNVWLEQEHKIAREQQVGHALFMPASQTARGDVAVPLTGGSIRRIVRYSVAPYVRELLLERGRDPSSVLAKLDEFFGPYYGDAADAGDA